MSSAESTDQVTMHPQVNQLISSKFHYYFGFFANVLLVLFFLSQTLSYAPLSFGTEIGTLLGYFAAGYLVWTFSEYLLHRWLYHEIRSIFSKGHDMHHDEPLGLLGIPWMVNTAAILSAYALLCWFAPRVPASAFVGGFWLGYLGYTVIHHGLHRWKLQSRIWKSLWRHHKVHHKYPEKNLGVSTTLWDYVFRSKV